jgi:hypothetical protein
MQLDLPAPLYRLYLLFDHITGIIRRAAMLDRDLYGLINSGVGLNPYIMLGVVLMAAASLMVGRAALLLYTRAPRVAIPRAVINDGLRLLAGYLGAAIGLWLIGRLLLTPAPNMGRALQFSAFSYAPLALAALAATPRIGRFILIGLYVWSAVVLVTLLRYTFEASLPMALLCVAATIPGRYAGEAAFNWLINPPTARLDAAPSSR